MGKRQDRLMTVREVAGHLRVHPESVRRWCRAGRIPFVRVFQHYRFWLSEIEAWVENAWKGEWFKGSMGTGGDDGEAEGE